MKVESTLWLNVAQLVERPFGVGRWFESSRSAESGGESDRLAAQGKGERMKLGDILFRDVTVKDWIDSASYGVLLNKWRFASPGEPIFQGESGEYYANVMFEKKEADPGGAVAVSKALGWEVGAMTPADDAAVLKRCPWNWHGLPCALTFGHGSPHQIVGEQPQFDGIVRKAQAEQREKLKPLVEAISKRHRCSQHPESGEITLNTHDCQVWDFPDCQEIVALEKAIQRGGG